MKQDVILDTLPPLIYHTGTHALISYTNIFSSSKNVTELLVLVTFAIDAPPLFATSPPYRVPGRWVPHLKKTSLAQGKELCAQIDTLNKCGGSLFTWMSFSIVVSPLVTFDTATKASV